MKNIVFPFPAVLGQEKIKKALMWNVVNPRIGGLLISGEKGTAKSTLVRGLAAMIDDLEVVELPLNTTEDRLVGAIDLESAIKHGIKRFEVGILKKAHGNMLYVDEVNLLSDHIVNSLLEVAASGVNVVEREGISCRHPSRFVLVGSMNPEEGKLRAQFLDRFGLYVEVKGEEDTRERAEIIRRRLEFERDPKAYVNKWAKETIAENKRIKCAREALKNVVVTDNAMQLAASIAKEGNCAGHRAELVIVETAKAIVALDGRIALNAKDIREAAEYALPHRIRDIPDEPLSQPPEQEPLEEEQQEEQQQTNDNSPTETEDNSDDGQQLQDNPPSEPESQAEGEQQKDSEDILPQDKPEAPDQSNADGNDDEQIDEPGQIFMVKPWIMDDQERILRKGSGKRSLVKTSSMQGRYVKYKFPRESSIQDIAFDATLRAAAPFQRSRDKNGMAVALQTGDIRLKVREKRTGNTILFVVDASGSMGANKRMKAVKGAILSLLTDAYQKRDKVGLIAFRKKSAELLLGITRSVELAQKRLQDMPTGGRTPLAEGLNMAYDVLKAAKVKDPDIIPVVVLVSDGRANFACSGLNAFDEAVKAAGKFAAEGIKSIVINTDCDFIRLDLADKIADAMHADHFRIEDLEAESIVTALSMSV
ncbi:MAG: magnesium chelatase [Firmicutes bacterium HGW-Firmicutes-8]|nr:MAG: magnesium chelatase [Firmicutes bacterium HGW-Firmicutes-8]